MAVNWGKGLSVALEWEFRLTWNSIAACISILYLDRGLLQSERIFAKLCFDVTDDAKCRQVEASRRGHFHGH
jgi:hypothetical protein